MAKKNAISPTREENYAQWYQEVIDAADLAENSSVRGCMVIKPWGWAIWEHMQRGLDDMFKATGHENAYFPLFIPKSFLEKEAEHVEGFAKECAVVTHTRLEAGPDGGLVVASPLEEPLIVRPTSETIIGASFAKWIESYRDLPIKINQWANVVRWEMRTRLFLRTSEFLWQEGHTAHTTKEEAMEETETMLDVYARFAEEFMAVPVIQGEKSEGERFPGADVTLTIEAMMQDRKALQAGTSHFLGQNFARAQEIKYLSKDGVLEHCWTTSWGVSTRLVGALIMTHSDDDGLIVPPRLAPKHIVLLPIIKNDEQRAKVLPYCESLKAELEKIIYEGAPLRVAIDDRDLRGGVKMWQHVKRGVPLRAEVGERDIAKDSVFLARRDTGQKEGWERERLLKEVTGLLSEIQNGLFERAVAHRAENTVNIDSLDDLRDFFTPKNAKQPEIHGGFAMCHWVDDPAVDEILKPLAVTVRCIPRSGDAEPGTCIFTGKPSERRVVLAKAY